ncbi:MAG: EamA family transporter [bacterium]|nr:EamA family transporter [bacterium]
MEAAVLFAVGASFLLACRDITGRLGMREVDPLTGTAVSAFVGLPVLALVSFFLGDFSAPWPELGWPVLYIALAGIFRITAARTLLFSGMKHIGAARAGSLATTNIFFAMIFSVLFLGERLTVTIVLGTLLIVAGCLLLGRSRAEQVAGSVHASLRGITLALLSALAFGLSVGFVRPGIHAFASPNQANLFANIVGFLTYLPLLWGRSPAAEMRRWSLSSWAWLVAAGGVASMGVTLFYFALARAPVVVAAPIAQTRPVFVVLFSWLLLQQQERVNWRVSVGTLVIVAGAALLIVGR